MGSNWEAKVFRLRSLPTDIQAPADVSKLLGTALGIPADHVSVCSLATTCNKWEVPPSKVATLQLKSAPRPPPRAIFDDEWSFPLPGGRTDQVLLLDTHFRGLTVMNDPEPGKHEVDCIAISGLASHPIGSWQPRGDKTFMWIRDAVPQALPSIRNIIYGYDSKLLKSNSFQSISDLAQSFVLSLGAAGWDSPSSKPILFLAHSLGGIVLKEAIVKLANSTDKGLSTILGRVPGAIMFGVPNLGMQSHLLALVEGQANEFLVDDLSREGGGSYVRDLNTRFKGLSFVDKARILWAYETEESPTVTRAADGTWSRDGPPTVLVDRNSATCHYYQIDRSVTIPINRDHSGMVKFTRGDPNLGVIIQALANLCSISCGNQTSHVETEGSGDAGERAVGIHSVSVNSEPRPGKRRPRVYSSSSGSELEPGMVFRPRLVIEAPDGLEDQLQDLGYLLHSVQNMHDRLYLPELNDRVEQIEVPHQNTFQWVFNLPVFCRWLQEDFDLLWIHGKPGSGKSTLMKYIYQSRETRNLLHDWRADSVEIKGCFFFHHRGSPLQKSFEGVLRSLIIQIMEPHRRAFEKEAKRIWDRYEALKLEQARLERQLKIVLQELDESRRSKTRGVAPVGGIRPANSRTPANSRSDATFYLPNTEDGIRQVENRLNHGIAQIQREIADLGKEFQDRGASPQAKLIGKLVAEYHQERDEEMEILGLEKILRLLLDQQAAKMDLVLFFDALDEFDGHPVTISRFLKGLVKTSPASNTRVKKYTKSDIEEYASSSVAGLQAASPSVRQLVPAIITRANGVFLWVRLAIDILHETVESNPNTITSALLDQKLQALPNDLLEFYRLIVKRISRDNRRYTYALLELLIRHNGSPMRATDVRDAVLVSGCVTYGEAKEVLAAARQREEEEMFLENDNEPTSEETQIRNQLTLWGGGLVEIKRQDSIDYPRLMHQTALEFIASPAFKTIVLGEELSDFVKENGHHFYVKYWILEQDWVSLNRQAIKSVLDQMTQKGHQRALLELGARYSKLPLDAAEIEVLQSLAYHAEHAEITADKSVCDYIISAVMPTSEGRRGNSASQEEDFLVWATSCGLTRCLVDWTDQRRDLIKEHSTRRRPQVGVEVPALTSLFFAPPDGKFYDRYLDTFGFLLDNGYRHCKAEFGFFGRITQELWRNQFVESKRIPDDTLEKVAIKLLRHDDDYYQHSTNTVELEVNADQDSEVTQSIWATPLHVASPALTTELLCAGANPNGTDTEGRTPLHWALDPPKEARPRTWDTAWRFKKALMLARAGAKHSVERDILETTLTAFESEGYGTQPLREALGQGVNKGGYLPGWVTRILGIGR